MATFHGPVNLNLGEPVWAASQYDHDAHGYVVDVSGEDLKKFRAVAADYGFVEDKPAKADKDA